MEKIILHGRKVVGGIAEGEAMVTKEALGGWGSINDKTGEVIDIRHEWAGKNIKGKVIVFRGAKGSSGWSGTFHRCRANGIEPAAMIYNETTTKVALGAVVTRVPAVTDLDQDPTDVIREGDWVRVDGDNGIVEITRKQRG